MSWFPHVHDGAKRFTHAVHLGCRFLQPESSESQPSQPLQEAMSIQMYTNMTQHGLALFAEMFEGPKYARVFQWAMEYQLKRPTEDHARLDDHPQLQGTCLQSLRDFTFYRSLKAEISECLGECILPKKRAAIENSCIYGMGIMLMSEASHYTGSVKRLAGGLVAYMLFDHLSDQISDLVLRRLVTVQMFKFWCSGKWSHVPPPAAVRRVLDRNTRTAMERCRRLIVVDRHDPVAAHKLMLTAARAVHDDKGAPELQGVCNSNTVNCDTMFRSITKTVPSIIFLLQAYMDDGQSPTIDWLGEVGAVAAFAQLLDDVLDRESDVNEEFPSTPASLSPSAAWKLSHSLRDTSTAMLNAKIDGDIQIPIECQTWFTELLDACIAWRNPSMGVKRPETNPYVWQHRLTTWLESGR
jgi:hypothetical protein